MKKFTILAMLIVMFLNAWDVKGQQCPIDPNCLVSSVILNTGKNHQINASYPITQRDEYWRLVSGPSTHGPYPRCPFVISNTVSGGSLSATANGIADGNVSQNNKCNYNGTPYVFQRDFKVCTGTGNPVVTAILNTISFSNDLKVTDIRIIQPSGLSFVISTSCWPNGANTIPPYSFPVQTGEYTLQITVGNDWTNTANWPFTNYNGQTGMSLDYQGFVISSAIFVDNNHFGKNVNTPSYPNYCAPAYFTYVIPVLSATNTCIPSNGTTTITHSLPISNPGMTYEWAAPINSSSTTAIVPPGTYTLNCIDPYGCIVYAPTITIHVKPNMNVTNQPCAPNGITTLQCSSGSPNLLANPYSIISPTIVSFSGTSYQTTGPNNYVVQVKDAFGCTGTTTTKVGSVFNVFANSSNCITPPTPSILSCSTSLVLPNTTYQLTSPPNSVSGFGTNNTFNVLNTGVYTVTAKDAYGCTATNTINMILNSVPILNITKTGGPCMHYDLTVNPLGLPFATWSPAVSNTNNPWVSVPPTTATYTATVTDANGCTRTATTSIVTNPFCCMTSTPTLNTHYFSVYTNNGNASGIIADFGTNVITTNDDIYLGGDIQIDQNITFLNCPNIFLMPDAQLILNNGRTLTITNSHLQPGCGTTMWKGIVATNNTQSITIQTNSIIEGMKEGVQILGIGTSAAMINCTNSIFKNDFVGLVFSRLPLGYNGIVTGNEFFSNISPSIMVQGIYISNCRTLNIGNVSTSVNYFHDVLCGIKIVGSGSFVNNIMDIELNNNHFENITGGLQVNNYYNNSFLNSIYNNGLGCGIFASPLQTSSTNVNINLNVNYTTNIAHFKNLDKAIVTNRVNATIQNAHITDSKAGIMNSGCNGRKCIIENNIISNVLVGISTNGNNSSASSIKNNIITLENVVAPYYGFGGNNNTPFFPCGIKVTRFTNSYNALFDIDNNYITIPSEIGEGVELNNTGDLVNVTNNKVCATTTLIKQKAFIANWSSSIPNIYCFRINNADKTLLKANSNEDCANNMKLGIYSGAFSVSKNCGILFTKSTNLKIFCNEFKYIQYGFFVQSGCLTAPTNIGNNKSTLIGQNAWRFEHLGSEATFGNVGTLTTDMNNRFGQPAINAPIIYRLSVCGVPSNDRIRTSPLQLQNSNSFGNNVLCNYWVLPSSAAPFWCTPPLNITNPNEDELADIDYAKKIAQGGVDYPEFDEATLKMEQQALYDALRRDTTVIAGEPVLDSFYHSINSQLYQNVALTDEEMNNLFSDTTLNNDSTLFAQQINEARTANALINSTENAQINLRTINRIYLDIVEGDDTLLPQTDYDFVETLALSCPFVEGEAVYKARSILAMFQTGIDYDDRAICAAVGQYKGGTNHFAEENKMMEEEFNKLHQFATNPILLYPNPATEMVTVEYQLAIGETGILNFYDLTGRKIKTIELTNNIARIQIDIKQFNQGVYTYQFLQNNRITSVGKLTVKK
jgi:hypothetical protein